MAGRNRGRGGRRRKLPQVQRVGAYAVIIRAGAGEEPEILLSRLSEKVTPEERWTLPGGGIDHGEDPRDAVVREVYEEAGVPVEVGTEARVQSVHQAKAWRLGRRVNSHAIRIVYDGWVPHDAPEPQTMEVDGSTAEAAWLPLAAVTSGEIPTSPLVTDALDMHRPARMQRLAAYAFITRASDDAILLTRISPRGYHAGSWTLPGGGLDFGEHPREALVREVAEECGLTCATGKLLDVHDVNVVGTAPSGRHEEFHGVHLIFAATVPEDAEPRVVEQDGTTDAVRWVSRDELASLPLLDVVTAALDAEKKAAS
ncbi:8-oxo-dGTP diphosphatase [Nocardioides albertanoniae]|uniref:8-oxo-dGTP diphosphatase n=1 Tax=Nocardioides albertanoniae TaxID=1175486 RepID=A0A543AD17_9ACTN|nr:NUDIX domain-containing protein [Nocardioides albertanoniae]TQL70481.1 8-oxo-dGTP diphosphatase [Nocardioides albertanoniae]